MGEVFFHFEDANLSDKTSLGSIPEWLHIVSTKESKSIKTLNFIFCSDEYLFQINKTYLNHHDYTDVITFDNSDEQNAIEGDIFISLDRVAENAESLKQEIIKELSRVIIHGVLHLIGYKDKTTSEKSVMRNKEDTYLSLLDKSST